MTTGSIALTIVVLMARIGFAQPATFAGSPQHTAQYAAPAQRLNRVLWSTSVNLNNSGSFAHYGAPLITPANTVIASARTATGFMLSAFDGATGRLKYSLTNDYISPAHSWIPAYQPVLATSASGTRLYYPGAGGTIFYIDNPDSDTPNTAVHQCFYTNLDAYSSNATAYNNTIFVNTPITADPNGAIFFGFRVQTNAVQTNAPAPLNTTQCGYVRVDPDGNAIYVLAGDAAADPVTTRVPHNCAPALSNDGATLYVTVKWTVDAFNAYLLGLDSTTLATKYKVFLKDPRNGNRAGVLDDATASPTIGPDGDVYLGVAANPGNGSRGFLLHFSGDLQTQKLPSGFGWDYTPGLVPTNMIPGYSGPSSYLLFSKYNNYAGAADGDGINKIAILDPNASEIDPHPTANRLAEMREVLVAIGNTPDPENFGSTFPFAVREWCINTSAINPATGSLFVPSEDGRIYRWDLAVNSLTETLSLTPGVGEPYVPTVISPDGTVYTLNGGTLFALGSSTNVSVGIFSSMPDLTTAVKGQELTFTAIISNLDGSATVPTGTVSFQDVTYFGLVALTNMLATNVALIQGQAQVATSTLDAGGNYLGNHFITAFYSGDTNFEAGTASLVQKVHASATSLALSSSLGTSNAIILTASVTSSPPGGGRPTGMVRFWDGATLLGQVPLNTNGITSITNIFSSGSHSFHANYNSDTLFAASTGSVAGGSTYLTSAADLGNGSLQLTFSNSIGAQFTILGATDLTLPFSNWIELGPAVEISPGQYQFIDSQLTNNAQRFYRVRSP